MGVGVFGVLLWLRVVLVLIFSCIVLLMMFG